jgi:proprotein convertase subtilisin/kexin type 5
MKRTIIVACFIAFLAILSMSQMCPRGCSACTGISCSSCESAFIKNGTKCVPCGMDCSTCTIVDRKIVCSACNTPTNAIINGACTPCAVECVAGQCSGNPNFCTSCKFGITPVNGTCPKQNCTMEGCGNCPTPSTCTTCIRGYYKDGSNICQKCSSVPAIGGPKCVSCSSVSACTQCAPGFYIDSGVCTACQANAITCTSSAATLCKTGYRPNGANCERCTPPCKTCSSSVTTCTSCLPPTTLKAGNIC